MNDPDSNIAPLVGTSQTYPNGDMSSVQNGLGAAHATDFEYYDALDDELALELTDALDKSCGPTLSCPTWASEEIGLARLPNGEMQSKCPYILGFP